MDATCSSWEPDAYFEVDAVEKSVTVDFCPTHVATEVCLATRCQQLQQGTCQTTFTDVAQDNVFILIHPLCTDCSDYQVLRRYCDAPYFEFGPYHVGAPEGSTHVYYQNSTVTANQSQSLSVEAPGKSIDGSSVKEIIVVSAMLFAVFLVFLAIACTVLLWKRQRKTKAGRKIIEAKEGSHDEHLYKDNSFCCFMFSPVSQSFPQQALSPTRGVHHSRPQGDDVKTWPDSQSVVNTELSPPDKGHAGSEIGLDATCSGNACSSEMHSLFNGQNSEINNLLNRQNSGMNSLFIGQNSEINSLLNSYNPEKENLLNRKDPELDSIINRHTPELIAFIRGQYNDLDTITIGYNDDLGTISDDSSV